MASDEFRATRTQLQQQREQLTEAERALLLAREKRRQVDDRLGRFERSARPGSEVDARERERLRTLAATTERRIETLTGRVNAVAQRLEAVAGRFVQFTDPRDQMERLDDAYPILLLPLRMETRFKRLSDPDGTRHQLWVRVYPDDCAVDAFEETLTETEVRNARRYWANAWRAGGEEAGLRAAWRNLVASHGAGRAAWIARSYRPLNEEEVPAGGPGVVILVIVTSDRLEPAVEGRAAEYWRAVWRAHGDPAALDLARAALVERLGTDRARAVIESYRPFNLDDQPPNGTTRATATVVVSTVHIPADDDVDTRRRPWSRAPRVSVLPDRLVLLGYDGDTLVLEELGNPIPSPLIVGPDPQTPDAEQLRRDGADLAIPDAIRWMVDFDEAVRVGMGFTVDLTPRRFSSGFDRLMVLGVRLGFDEVNGQRAVEALLRSHQLSRPGLALLRQGTPTNNTDDTPSGFSTGTDADATFALVTGTDPLFEPADDWFGRTDGDWLARILGIDPAVLQRVPGADHTDVAEAQAMNVALFPATIGYLMDTMLAPVFEDDDVEFTRQFFTRFVTGRGMLSALRIGSQPYGILPATVYSRLDLDVRDHEDPIRMPQGRRRLQALQEVVMRAHEVWDGLTDRVARVGDPGADAHRTLLDAIGLHPHSVELDQRYAKSLSQVINELNLQGWLAPLVQALALHTQGTQILRDHGYDVDELERPSLLDRYFFGTTYPLDVTNVIHDEPLSEREPIRAYVPDGRNYIEWLVDAARTSLEAVRSQDGFEAAPTELLYRMLRHAIMLGYFDAGVRLSAAGDEGDRRARARAALRREATFIHVVDSDESESRFALLYRPGALVGAPEGLSVAEYITSLLPAGGPAERLAEQISATARLRHLPTARLERAFLEHLDTCSYRLDAWLQGLAQYRLTTMREAGGEHGRHGLYAGAFGWLEDVRPSKRVLQSIDLDDPELAAAFQRPGDAPLAADSRNAGYVHAPSPNHAVTAAVLRNGYRVNADRDEPGIFAVNLSSERVRRAMGIVEGIRNGQSVGALLGYQFERGLHDRHDEAEVDEFIFKLRKAFPLVADRMRDTARPVPDDAAETEESIEAIEARNVLDGAALAEHVRAMGDTGYPFGVQWLPAATPAQATAINAEVQRLLDSHDAVADLGMAEGIHQVVQGNYDRAAASTDAFTGDALPPIPDVVQTPRRGLGLTHRVGLHLRPVPSPTAPAPTPRSGAEPALNDWLAGLMPAPDQVGVRVRRVDRNGDADEIVVTQDDLGLEPVDLLYLLEPEDEALTALDDHIAEHVLAGHPPDTQVAVLHTQRIAPRRSFFEVAALLGELRPLVLGARPLRADDLVLPNEGDATTRPPPVYHPARLIAARSQIASDAGNPLGRLRALVGELESLMADPDANRVALVSGIDGRLDRFATAAAKLYRFGVPAVSFGFARQWRRARYVDLLERVTDLVDRWQTRLDEFEALLAEYDDLPAATTDEERFRRLTALERSVAVEPTAPTPATPAAYRTLVVGRRDVFATKRGEFEALQSTTTPELATVLSSVSAAAVDLLAYDFRGLGLEDDRDEIVRFSGDLFAHARGIVDGVEQRLATFDAGLSDYDGATTAQDAHAAFTAAAHALFGEDFLVVPEFNLDAEQGPELQNAYDATPTLLDHLSGTLGMDLPVDDWLYGVARVRDAMQRWEAVSVLADALAGIQLDLRPLQLPYRDDDRWVALPYPEELALDTDRLLYTAHFAVPFDSGSRQCGLLLDEWTEVIPAVEETTAVCFHYDRPNAEPPQVMLLAAPPSITGSWRWQDLVDCVREAFALARSRAVEPDHIASTDYARFLPATISAVTFHPITIAMNYAVTNPRFLAAETRE